MHEPQAPSGSSPIDHEPEPNCRLLYNGNIHVKISDEVLPIQNRGIYNVFSFSIILYFSSSSSFQSDVSSFRICFNLRLPFHSFISSVLAIFRSWVAPVRPVGFDLTCPSNFENKCRRQKMTKFVNSFSILISF